MDIDAAWKSMEACLDMNSKKESSDQREVQKVCKSCQSDNLAYDSSEVVCYDCGVIQYAVIQTCESYDNSVVSVRKTSGQANSKLQRMQEWYMWSNEEKNSYKLSTYTKSLCSQLNIPEAMVKNVCDTVITVMNAIKKHDGTKRARVKDGIILTCIQYVSNDGYGSLSAVDLAKTLGIDVKYVTKADKLILELINTHKLNLDKCNVLETQKPFYHVKRVIQKHKLSIPPILVTQVEHLIDVCEKNDLLLDHTPLSIGVCCFYYILKNNDVKLDIKQFADLYNLSVVTIIKTYNKLKQHDEFISQHIK